MKCQRTDLPIWVYGSPRVAARHYQFKKTLVSPWRHLRLGDTVKMRNENEVEGLMTMSLESISQRLQDGRFTSELLVKVRGLRVGSRLYANMLN